MLYSFEGEEEDQLTLKEGDIIKDCDKNQGQGWWSGTLKDKVGLFPGSYVEVSFPPRIILSPRMTMHALIFEDALSVSHRPII